MFGFNRPGKIDLEVTLDRPQKTYVIGDEIAATIRLTCARDLAAQGKVEFFCRESFQIRRDLATPDRDAPDDSSRGRQRPVKLWLTNDSEPHALPMPFTSGIIPGGITHTFVVKSNLRPIDPPTVHNAAIIKVDWLVRAVLFRRRPRGLQRLFLKRLVKEVEVDFVVASAAPPKPRPGGHRTRRQTSLADLTLKLPSKTWAAGATIEGELIVGPKQEFAVRGIRLELAKHESVPQELGNNDQASFDIQLDGKRQFKPGQAEIYPFQFPIPPNQPPTIRIASGEITWTLVGVLDLPGQADRTIRRPIVVL